MADEGQREGGMSAIFIIRQMQILLHFPHRGAAARLLLQSHKLSFNAPPPPPQETGGFGMRTKHNRGAAARTQMIDERHHQDFLRLNCIKSSCSPHRVAFTLSLVRCVSARASASEASL